MILGMMLSMAVQTVDAAPQPQPASERLRLAAPEAAAFPNTTLQGYVVEATSPRAIRAEMNRMRPSSNGRSHDATTTWRYSYSLAATNGQCDPAAGTVSYAVTITMPDLKNRDRLRRSDRQAWDRYFAALQTHEVNHARIAQLGAAQSQAALRSAADCQAGRAALSQINAEVSAASAEYDRRTEHGRREGATFP